MECVVVQDLFLNETAKFAHVFLPGSSFLEKDGTFTNAERRINRVRKVMPPLAGKADWESRSRWPRRSATRCTTPPVRDHGRDRRLTPTFAGVSFAKLDELGSIQWPCNDGAGRHADHACRRVRARQGPFMITEYVPTDEKATALPADPDHRPHPQPVQRRRADAAHRQRRLARRGPCSRSIRTTPKSAASDGDWVHRSRAGETALRATITERHPPGVVYTTFHHPGRAPTSSPPRTRLGHQLPGVQGDGGAGVTLGVVGCIVVWRIPTRR
jgi:formate dehydrogenase major subunit